MASVDLLKEEQNFIRFVKVCVDVLKLPLIDILACEIKPVDLYDTLQSSSLLKDAKIKLRSDQLKICYLAPPAIPDYNTFDLTMLYTLIRNLCPSLKPSQNWGFEPRASDLQIGDDIERLRLSRNNFVHSTSARIPDGDFEALWMYLKTTIQRMQQFMMTKGYSPNYEQRLADVKELDISFVYDSQSAQLSHLEHIYDHLKQNDDKDDRGELEIMTVVTYGETARFKAAVAPGGSDGWSVTWQRLIGDKSILIDTNENKFAKSTDEQLVIQPVCMEDDGKYQAAVYRNNIKTSSKTFFLHVVGGQPVFDTWTVKAEKERIIIYYKVLEVLPDVHNIKWAMNGATLDCESKKYLGGGLKDCHLIITSPTGTDIGRYSCTVTNGVGTASKEVIIDVPHAVISTEQQFSFGFSAAISSIVVSCPPFDGLEWQKSIDGIDFHPIDISQPKYYGSSYNLENPVLVIQTLTFEDRLHYRLLVKNIVGKKSSNTVFLNVVGGPPNINVNHKTNIHDHSVDLIGNVFVYKKHPAVHKVCWTKDGQKIDSLGCGGKYSKVSIADPSLTIFDVNSNDAGSYQLIATNTIGSTASASIVLSIPDVFMAEPKTKEDGTHMITVTIKSIPEPYFVRWSLKEKHSDAFKPIDVNTEKYKGTSNYLPHPVLIASHLDELEKYCFQIEVRNFIGSCKKTKILDLTRDEQTTTVPPLEENQNNRIIFKRKTRTEEAVAMALDTQPREKTGPFTSLVETSKRTPTEKELASVSEHIGRDFYVLGLHLGLTSATIDQIQMTYNNCARTQILKILLSWKNKHGSQATIEKLLQAVKTHSNNVDIFKIERIFECD